MSAEHDSPEPAAPRLPHTLHLTIDHHGWMEWRLDCPYDGGLDQPGRNCNLLSECDPDQGSFRGVEGWEPTLGCFAAQCLAETSFEDAVCVNAVDPSFPMLVDVHVDGWYDDAWATVVPWTGGSDV